MADLVDDMRLVSEASLCCSPRPELADALGITVEGAAAASWAAASWPTRIRRPGPALVIVTGSNVPPAPDDGVTVRAVLPREPAAFARSILPLVLIVLAASVRGDAAAGPHRARRRDR